MQTFYAEKKGDNLVVAVSGKIDTSNALKVEAEIEKARQEYPHESITLDFEDLQYISSAGLRVILRLKKEEPALKVVNVRTEVYEIFEMTGFSEIIDVEKGFRKFSVDGREVIGEGAKGTVYRYNEDTIIKVYKNDDCLPLIQRESELARKAFVLGIPTAISFDVVKVGDKYGSVFEMLDAKTLSELIAEEPDGLGNYVDMYAALLRQIHSTIVNPNDMPDVKELVNKWIEACVPFLTEDQNIKIRSLIDAVPDTMSMLHCDYHTNNIMMQNGEAILIDMDTLCHGHPIFELANIFVTYVGFGEINPEGVEKFLGIPYDKAVEFWNRFLPKYLGSDEKVHEVEDKAKLLGYIRFLRHIARRGIYTDETKRAVEYCVDKIGTYIEKVDSLSF